MYRRAVWVTKTGHRWSERTSGVAFLVKTVCLLVETRKQGPGALSVQLNCLLLISPFNRRDLRTDEYCLIRFKSRPWKDGIAFKDRFSESFSRNFPGIFGNQQQHYLDVIKRMLVQCMQDQEHPSVRPFTSVTTNLVQG